MAPSLFGIRSSSGTLTGTLALNINGQVNSRTLSTSPSTWRELFLVTVENGVATVSARP